MSNNYFKRAKNISTLNFLLQRIYRRNDKNYENIERRFQRRNYGAWFPNCSPKVPKVILKNVLIDISCDLTFSIEKFQRCL